MTGFENQPTAALLAARTNLLAGLELAAEHVAAGTLHTRAGADTPPAAGGWLTLMLLRGVDAELTARGHRPLLDAEGGPPCPA